MKAVVGLGNPGREYEATPHNAGFAVVEELASRHAATLKKGWRFQARTGKARYGDDALLLVEPLTFMNRSGSAVASVLRYNRIEAGDLVVVTDDADLPAGRVRVRVQGSSGGHRGLESVIESLGTRDFVRVRIGIGRGKKSGGLVDYVLSPLKGDEAEVFRRGVRLAADAVECVIARGAERAMNEFNGLKPEGEDDGKPE